LYKAAGLEFNFSPERIQKLMKFVQEEMEEIKRSSIGVKKIPS
jgi:hypothetical protein